MSIVYFLNVGEGDCSVIEHNSGRLTMIDINRIVEKFPFIQNNSSILSLERFGNPKGNFHQCEHPTDPIEFLKNNYPQKDLFRFILTHPDMDHLKGLKDLSEKIGFTNFWSYKNSKDGTSIRDEDLEDWNFYQTLLRDNKFLNLVDINNCQYLPDDGLKILSPNNELISKANNDENWNDASATILYMTGGYKFLFCGDSGDNTWDYLIRNHKNEINNIDVLFAPHHGRNSDRNFDFLDIVRPNVTILGNAESKYLAHDMYKNKSGYVFTNNQAGNFKFEINAYKELEIYFSNEKFAESFCLTNGLTYVPKENWFKIGFLKKNYV